MALTLYVCGNLCKLHSRPRGDALRLRSWITVGLRDAVFVFAARFVPVSLFFD